MTALVNAVSVLDASRESQGLMRVEEECARHLGRPSWSNEGTDARQCGDTLSNELSQALFYTYWSVQNDSDKSEL
jgi:hypothetical protein